MIISLIGMMGCGKSSVGKELSECLGCLFTDLDEEIEKAAGRSIPEFFASEGEAAFRKMELSVLQRIIKKDNPGGYRILACGGGTPLIPAAASLLKEHTLCIYLQASAETLEKNLGLSDGGSDPSRPLLAEGGAEKLRKLLEERESVYIGTASTVLPTDGATLQEIADEIIITCL